MERKIRVGAVSYLNTKPLVYAFEKGEMSDKIEVIMDYPANIADMLKEDIIDIGLVPIAVIPELKEHYIISDYCIGCDGEVASVCLFSEVPLETIERIYLDYQSRTSVELLKLLIKKHWKIDPVLEVAGEGFQQNIKGTTAGLVIGNRALEQRKISTYIYDLGAEWKKFTGLSFVFATWVSNKKLPESFIKDFNLANKKSIEKISIIADSFNYPTYDLNKYYNSNLKYIFTERLKKGMDTFLNMMNDSSN